jgi:hypothetical protein
MRSRQLRAALPAALLLAGCGDAADVTAPAARPPVAAGGGPALAAAAVPGPSGPGPGPIAPANHIAVTLHVGDHAAADPTAGVAGTTFRFAADNAFGTPVADNSPADLDARVGYYRVWVPVGLTYTATAYVVPERFSSDSATTTASPSGTPSGTPSVVPLGSILLRRKSWLTVELRRQGALVAGQTITITDGTSSWTATIADGGANDRSVSGRASASDGRIHVTLPFIGHYTVCATTTPHVYWAAACQTVHAAAYNTPYATTLTYVQKVLVGPVP